MAVLPEARSPVMVVRREGEWVEVVSGRNGDAGGNNRGERRVGRE